MNTAIAFLSGGVCGVFVGFVVAALIMASGGEK